MQEGQFELEGFGAPPPPQPTDRLFLALVPDQQTANSATALGQMLSALHGVSGSVVGTERLHVTLMHLGDFAGLSQAHVEMASSAAVRMCHTPFNVRFDRVMCFHRANAKMPLVLTSDGGNEGLMSFQESLRHELLKRVCRKNWRKKASSRI